MDGGGVYINVVSIYAGERNAMLRRLELNWRTN